MPAHFHLLRVYDAVAYSGIRSAAG